MAKKVKIFIDDITQPWGTERAVVNLANNLASHAYDVEIVSSYSSSGDAAFYLNSNVAIRHLSISHLKSGISILDSLRGIYELRKAFTGVLCDQKTLLIGTNSVINSILSSMNLPRKWNIDAVIGCEHLPHSFGTKFTFALRGAFYKYLDYVVLLTEKDALRYRQSGLKNTQVIPNEAPNIASSSVKERRKVLISVGRLTSQKGFDILIEDISPVLREFTDWNLEIYGEGEMRPLLSQMIADLKMQQNIFLCGSTENLQDKYGSSSLYLMSSRYEGLPMVLLEAQAYALPVVAYDCETGPSEIIEHGESGYLIPMGNSDEFRKRVRELIMDDEKRESMGRVAVESAQRFSTESIFLKWKPLLEKENPEKI